MRYLIKNLPEEQKNNAVIKHLDRYGIAYNYKGRNVLEVVHKISPQMELQLKKEFASNGYVLKKDNKSILIEDIKHNISKLIVTCGLSEYNLSFYLSRELGYSYTYLSNIFTEEQGISIKQYIILQKIEKVKVMIVNERLNMKQIASLMKYKSISHLTNQFKKLTGMTPSCFRKKMSTE